jgi:hypothetical protein
MSYAIDRPWLPVKCVDAGRRRAFLRQAWIARVRRAHDGQFSAWPSHNMFVPLAATFRSSLGLFEASADA